MTNMSTSYPRSAARSAEAEPGGPGCVRRTGYDGPALFRTGVDRRRIDALGRRMGMLVTGRLGDVDAGTGLHRQVKVAGDRVHHEVRPAERDYAQLGVGRGPDR